MEISAACLKMYFEGDPPTNQFLCRALLCQAKLKCPPATGSVVRTANWTDPLEDVMFVCFYRESEAYMHKNGPDVLQ